MINQDIHHTLDQDRASSLVKWGSLEFWFVIISLLGFTKPIFWLFDEDTIFNQGIIERLAWNNVLVIFSGIVFLGMAYYSQTYIRQVWKTSLAIWPLWLIVGLAALSLTWSIDPLLTVRRAAAIFLTTAFGIYIAIRLTPYQLLVALAIVISVGIVLSIGMILIAPHFAIMTGSPPLSYSWRGAYDHKGNLSRMAALGLIVCWLLLMNVKLRRVYTLLLWGGLATCTFMMLMASTRSTSAAAVLAVGIAYILQFHGWRLSNVKVAPSSKAVFASSIALATLGLTVFASIFVEPERFVSPLFLDERRIINGVWYDLSDTLWNTEFQSGEGLVKEDALETAPHLTGRTDLWRALWQIGKERPLLGYGYGAFWDGAGSKNFKALPADTQWAYSAHNGIFEIFLALGVVGVLVITVAIGWMAYQILKDYWGDYSHPVFVWNVAYLVYWGGINLIDSNLLNNYDIFWIITIAIIAQHRIQQPYCVPASTIS